MRQLKVLILAWFLVALFAVPGFAASYTGTCVAAYDGDTITVRINGKLEKIRLLGIDTPEMGQQPWGTKARDYTRSLVVGKQVRVETDVQQRDQYRRLLAYVYVGDTFLNEAIIRSGHAMLLTYPPNVAKTDVLTRAQTAARNEGKGVWNPSAPLTQSPRDYRHKPSYTRGQDLTIARQPKAKAQSPSRPQAASGQVSLNVNSLKYHEPSCRYYDCKNCEPMGLGDAQTRGGVAGKCCH